MERIQMNRIVLSATLNAIYTLSTRSHHVLTDEFGFDQVALQVTSSAVVEETGGGGKSFNWGRLGKGRAARCIHRPAGERGHEVGRIRVVLCECVVSE